MDRYYLDIANSETLVKGKFILEQTYLIRRAKHHEQDTIFTMGFDVWNDGLPFEDYLLECHSSKKYASGTWYVLVDDSDAILSSLIVYSGIFGLEEGSFGIGSIATSPSLRGNGYASQLITLVKDMLFTNHSEVIYLHSDIAPIFYEKLGFNSINNSDCMVCKKDSAANAVVIPKYF